MARALADHVPPELVGRAPLPSSSWQEVLAVLYASIRLVRPHRVIETGVGLVGSSSAFILAALAENHQGELWSVDLDRYHQIYGVHVGLGIPDRVRPRHHLLSEDSRAVLPGLLAAAPPAEIFFHDGFHSYRNMLFEYSAAWPHLPADGLLLSDDLANSALDDFAANGSTLPTFLRYGVGTFGGMRKPPDPLDGGG
jgi:hypothetical protein